MWKNSVESCVESCVKKLGGKSVWWKVYSVQYTLYNIQYGSDPKFAVGAPVFLSLGSGTICRAPALPHPSKRLKWAVVGDFQMEWNLVVGDPKI